MPTSVSAVMIEFGMCPWSKRRRVQAELEGDLGGSSGRFRGREGGGVGGLSQWSGRLAGRGSVTATARVQCRR